MGCLLDLGELSSRGFLLRSVKQVHGAEILDDLTYLHSRQEADGLVTDMKNQALLVKTADCVPLHLTDGRRVAVVHAGWRGTRSGIVKTALSRFEPDKTWAILGPAISAECYEVGRDCYEDWSHEDPNLADHLQALSADSTKRRLDLKGFIRSQLHRAGLDPERIRDVGVCTYQTGLPSYRRDGRLLKSIYSYIYRGS